MTEIINSSDKNSSNRHSNSVSEAEGAAFSRNKSTRNSTTPNKKKNGSMKSLVRKQAEVIVMNREKNLNFRGIAMFENHINVKVFKGKYCYELKYDPFNGGEMMNKQPKLNILEALGKYL